MSQPSWVANWPGAQQQTGNRQKVNALHYFFLGNEAFETSTPDSYRQAIDFYEQAIAADPDAPFGYVGMATVLWSDITQGWVYPDVPREELLKRGVDYAEMAISIDPTYYAAHIARGDMHFSAGEHEQAIVRYMTAVELNPSSSTAMAVANDSSALHRSHRRSDRLDGARHRGEPDHSWLVLQQPVPCLLVCRALLRRRAGDPKTRKAQGMGLPRPHRQPCLPGQAGRGATGGQTSCSN